MLKIIEAIGKITKRQISYVFDSAQHQNISSLKSNFNIITTFLGCAIWKPETTCPGPTTIDPLSLMSALLTLAAAHRKPALFSWHKVQQISLELSLYNFCSICVSSLNLASSIWLYDCSIKWKNKSKHVQNCCMKM